MGDRVKGWLGIVAVIAVGLVLSLVLAERYHHRILTLVFLIASPEPLVQARARVTFTCRRYA